MDEGFANVYADRARAEAYAKLGFPGTYFLAYRDLPVILAEHVSGTRALDLGCGTGRSTRFLRGLGFEVLGVDIAEPMLARAREHDPAGDYRLVQTGALGGLADSRFDLVLAAFTLDNVPTRDEKVTLLSAAARLLDRGGRIVNLVSSPAIYVHEWASFSTKDFPENRAARSGDRVRIVMLDVDDRRPVEDVLWTEADYRAVYDLAGLTPIETYRPLGKRSEPQAWVNETSIAPWTIDVLAASGTP